MCSASFRVVQKMVRAAYKPNSVSDSGYPEPDNDHSSRMPVAEHLLRPTLELGRAALKRSSIWSCTEWGLHSFSDHPENWCALTAPFHPYPVKFLCDTEKLYKAVYFLLHFPSRCRDSTLWSTPPSGVRTFLRFI